MQWTRERGIINDRCGYWAHSPNADYRIIPSAGGYRLYHLPRGTWTWKPSETTQRTIAATKELAELYEQMYMCSVPGVEDDLSTRHCFAYCGGTQSMRDQIALEREALKCTPEC